MLAWGVAFPQDRGVRPAPAEATDNQIWQSHKDYALLFATNEYDTWQHLNNPISDADAIAEVLKDGYGFETEVVKNRTRAEIIAKLTEYTKTWRGQPYGKANQLLIFFCATVPTTKRPTEASSLPRTPS